MVDFKISEISLQNLKLIREAVKKRLSFGHCPKRGGGGGGGGKGKKMGWGF